MIQANHYDVIVVGGGPAGSTTSALLAEQGHRVLLLEKERFPRYHVGESLMPYCYFPLERLGVIDQMGKLGFTEKLSVQFVTPDGKQSQPFYFFEHHDHPSSTTWQVNRDEFDMMMLENAQTKGVQVHQETKVRSLLKDGDGVVSGVLAEHQGGQSVEYYAPITVDATGRDSLTVTKER